MKDYYLILGLPQTATAAEIDAAFRRLALKYHPDVGPEEADALAPFKSAMEAHEVLSNAERRRDYDRKRNPGEQRGTWNPPGRARREFEDLSQAWSRLRPPGFRASTNVDAELRLVPEEACAGRAD